MRFSFFLIIGFILMIGCQYTEKDKSRAILDDEDTTSPVVDSNENASIEIEGEYLKARYEKSAAYAGVVDYYFRTEAGKQVKVSVIDLASEVDVQVPDFLLTTQAGEQVTNTEYIGREFALILQNNEVKEVKLLEQ